MPTHDIVDNRESVLIDHARALLRDSVSAKFAVAYLFTSGLAPIDRAMREKYRSRYIRG